MAKNENDIWDGYKLNIDKDAHYTPPPIWCYSTEEPGVFLGRAQNYCPLRGYSFDAGFAHVWTEPLA